MKKPIILAVDDDQQVLRAVARDLKSKYRSEYKVVSTTNPEEALVALVDYKKKGNHVALFLIDQRMPEMLGVEFLAKAIKLFPEAKRALLTAYSDTDAAIKAINEVNLDYYLQKPWNPPEEKLYPVLDDLLDSWQLTHRPSFEGIKVIGYQYSPFTHDIKEFLASNLFPFLWLDVERSKEARDLMELHGVDEKDLPIVIPYIKGAESDLGVIVNDTYFGKVPTERLTVKDQVIFFKGDGEYRSKIGLSPMRAKDIMGSYDATNGILTIVKYNKPAGVTDYVNSMWEIQDKPYSGDVVNSYNDGAPAPGKEPLGPFYELETSSPALALKAGERGTHIQITCHFEGDKDQLNFIAEKLLGVSIKEIAGVFK